MSHDFPIRPITVAEQAMLAAQRTVATGEREANPHPEGTDAHRRWDACFQRAMQLQTASEETEGGC